MSADWVVQSRWYFGKVWCEPWMNRDIKKIWTGIIIMNDASAKRQLQGHLTIIAEGRTGSCEKREAIIYYLFILFFGIINSNWYHIVCCKVTTWNWTETKNLVFVVATSKSQKGATEAPTLPLVKYCFIRTPNKEQQNDADTAGLLYFSLVLTSTIRRSVLIECFFLWVCISLALFRGTM